MRVYGVSDDLLELEDTQYKDDEIGSYDSEVIILFTDGTVIRCGYGKKEGGIWYIKVLKKGTADSILNVCQDEDAEIYSDVFEINAEVISHWVVDVDAPTPTEAICPKEAPASQHGQSKLQECESEEFHKGIQYAVHELMKALDVPGSNEIRGLQDSDDICTAAAEKIRKCFSLSE